MCCRHGGDQPRCVPKCLAQGFAKIPVEPGAKPEFKRCQWLQGTEGIFDKAHAATWKLWHAAFFQRLEHAYPVKRNQSQGQLDMLPCIARDIGRGIRNPRQAAQ